MTQVRKIELNGETAYELTLIHPITNEVVLESDGFLDLDDVAQFISDLGSAITESLMIPEDIKEGLKVE